MECGICLETSKKFVECSQCKKEWCKGCYDRLKKPLIRWESRQYYVSQCPYCRKNYLWGSKLVGIRTIIYKIRLDRSSFCSIQ